MRALSDLVVLVPTVYPWIYIVRNQCKVLMGDINLCPSRLSTNLNYDPSWKPSNFLCMKV